MLRSHSVRGFATKKALKTSNFVQKELKENPEFFKAFPHMQKVFDKTQEDRPSQMKERVMQAEDDPTKLYDYLHDHTVKWRDVKMEAPYFNSLLNKHNQYTQPYESKEEIIRENELNFIEGPSANADGPFKHLTRERIDEIHLEIDQRMLELTESGLSRNEILFDSPNIGIPLKDDAFFQLIRTSRTVREMLIKPNEEFTADRVIEKALRQDVGADHSQSLAKRNYKLGEYDDPTAPSWEYKKKYRDKDPLYDPEAQYAGHNVIGRS